MSPPRATGSPAPIGWCLAAAALFGASTPVAKILGESLGPFTLSGLFYLGAAAGTLPFARGGGSKEARRARGNRLRLGVAVLFGGAVAPVLLMLGLARALAGTVSLWLSLEIVFTAVVARFFFGESVGARGAAGIALVLCAAVGLAAAGTAEALVVVAPGVLFVAGACLCWSVDNNLVATVDGFTPAQSTAVKGAIAGSANLAIGLAVEGTSIAPGPASLALLVGALSYGASIVLYVAAAQQLGATRSQAIFSSAPFWGLAISSVVLGEPLGTATLAAAAVLVVAIVLVQSDVHSHVHRHDRLVHTHWHRHDDDHHGHAHGSPVPAGTWHVHEHEHEAQVHEHPHRPDLHHRH